ncbi:hypothetical protein KM043_010003 [Ampulex compressa]|nr:hypothetical protein KM043_010003 [Ampulex compressa]
MGAFGRTLASLVLLALTSVHCRARITNQEIGVRLKERRAKQNRKDSFPATRSAPPPPVEWPQDPLVKLELRPPCTAIYIRAALYEGPSKPAGENNSAVKGLNSERVKGVKPKSIRRVIHARPGD